MNASVKVDLAAAAAMLAKTDPNAPCLMLLGREGSGYILTVKAGTRFGDVLFDADTPVTTPADLETGADYGVRVVDRIPVAAKLDTAPGAEFFGGFHFAPGGNAAARSGGDSEPTINAFSIWDLHFRPGCPDPRGMTRVDGPRGKFWCDIYLLAVDHLAGTSFFGTTIADGDDPPQSLDGGGVFDKLDYETAKTVLAHHGKGLLSVEEFFAAAYGVTERTAAGKEPKSTGLDAPRTSRFGVMQATGNMWTWGHDGDPDSPRASIFGGSWLDGGRAGSRRAHLDCWPGDSGDDLGARGRCDHLQPA